MIRAPYRYQSVVYHTGIRNIVHRHLSLRREPRHPPLDPSVSMKKGSSLLRFLSFTVLFLSSSFWILRGHAYPTVPYNHQVDANHRNNNNNITAWYETEQTVDENTGGGKTAAETTATTSSSSDGLDHVFLGWSDSSEQPLHDWDEEKIVAALMESSSSSSSSTQQDLELSNPIHQWSHPHRQTQLQPRHQQQANQVDRIARSGDSINAPHHTQQGNRKRIWQPSKSSPESELASTAVKRNQPLMESFHYITIPTSYRMRESALTDSHSVKLPRVIVTLPEQAVPSQHNTCSSTTTTPTVAPVSSWVRRFLAGCSRDLLLPIPKDFLMDNFNLVQLAPVIERIGQEAMPPSERIGWTKDAALPKQQQQQPHHHAYPIYREALRLLIQDDALPECIPEFLHRAATALYVLLHQRYVVSPRGLDTIRRRFLYQPMLTTTTTPSKSLSAVISPIFGRCPRVQCDGMPLLPYGDSDDWGVSLNGSSSWATPGTAKRYCPSCHEIMYHWDSKIDGCAWGTSFAPLFLLECGDEIMPSWRQHPSPFFHTVTSSSTNWTGPKQMLYQHPPMVNASSSSGGSSTTIDHTDLSVLLVPRIFGFRFHPSVYHGWR